MANLIGPDVSFYQDDPETPQGIDFAKMAATAGYVIIRAGQNLWVDPDFKLNWSEARRVGLPRGSYWFYDSRIEPKRQAELWVQQFSGDFGELPLFADFEEAYGGVYKGWRNWYTFLERLKQLVGNKEIGIYTAYYYWRDNAPTTNPSNLEYFHQYPLWIANYGVTQPLVPKPWKSDEWLFWQFTEGGDGQLYGVESGGIDLNYFHGDEAAFKARFNIPDVPPPPPDDGTPTGKMYKVTASTLNVRLGPGLSFNVIGKLAFNEVVEEIGANADRTWLRVRRADGTLSGWCSAQYLEFVPTTPPPDDGTPTGRIYKVTASALKVREGPGLSYEAIGLLFLDEQVEEIGATPDRTWLRVRKADGSLKGWSSAEFLERVDVTPPPPPPPPPDDEGTPTGKKYRVIASVLNVRQGPGVVYNQIGQLPFNEVVEEIGANTDRTWLRVRKLDNSLRGWCFAAYLESLEIVPPPPPPPLPDDENANWYRVLSTTLVLRETPNPRSRSLAFFSKDDSVPALDDTSEPQWIRVRRLDGLTGWCERKSLSLRGPSRPSSYRQRIFNGVYYSRKELTDPRRNVVHVLGIDLQTTGMQFLVTPPSTADGILCTRPTSRFLQEFGMHLAINGDGFSYLDPSTTPPNPCAQGDPVKTNGYAVSRRKVYNPRKTADPIIYMNQRNQVTINEPKGQIVNAVSGDRVIVERGSVVKNLAAQSPQPRTALGLNKLGRWLTLLVVDGRQPGYSEGMTFPELAETMISFGAFTAVNMDGGSSSTMVIRGIDGLPRVLNIPIDLNTPGKESPVANHLGIFLQNG